MNYSSKSFLETKKFQTISIENQNQLNLNNLKSSAFFCKGSGCFNKLVVFKEGFVLGNNNLKLEGNIKYENQNFYGYNGNDWIPFNAEQIWEKSENNISINNKKLGIGKLNPKKLLDIAGDVQIDKKLSCNELASFEQGICIKTNKVKKIAGTIRFFENSFQGYNGENWIDFGNSDEFVLKVNQENKVITDDRLSFDNILLNKLDLHNSEASIEYQNKELKIVAPSLSVSNFIQINGGIKIGKNKIENISEPEFADDVVNKRYVDNLLKGLKSQLMVDYFLEEAEEGKRLIINENRVLLKDSNGILSLNEFPLKVLVNKGKYEGREIIIYENNNSINYHVSGNLTTKNFSTIFKLENENNISLKLGPNFIEGHEGLLLKEESIQSKHFTKNSIKNIFIEDNAITNEKIFNKSIDGLKIKNFTISSEHLKENIILAKHLQNNIIQSKHIGPNGVNSNNLCPELIQSIHLKSGIILNEHLTKNSVNGKNLIEKCIRPHHLTEKIITEESLTDNLIGSNHLKENSITNFHLNSDIISAEHLKGKIISEKHLTDRIITSEHICIKQIKSEHIAENSITEKHIKEGQIDKIHLKNDIISGEELESNSVDTHHIRDKSVDGSKLGINSILGLHLSKNIIDGKHLKNDIIDKHHLKRNIIDETHLSNSIIKMHHLAMGCITEAKIQEDAITSRKIRDSSIQNNKLKTPYLKIEFDQHFTGDNQVNLGDTLRIGINSNYYLMKKNGRDILLDNNIKIGEEETDEELTINHRTNFKGKIDFGRNQVMPIGSIIKFLKGIKVDERKYLKLNGQKITNIKYPQLFELLDERGEIELPNINEKLFDFYIAI